MSFTGLHFLLFITLFTAAFLALARTRLFTPFPLAASYAFYGWWDYRFCALLALTTAIDFWCGVKVEDAHGCAAAKPYLWFSIASNLAILFSVSDAMSGDDRFVDALHINDRGVPVMLARMEADLRRMGECRGDAVAHLEHRPPAGNEAVRR